MVYRILSLDGGGTWSLIQVKALMALYGENTSGHSVLKNFDLVAGNSGGSLVLGGLVENLKLSELFSYFQDENKRRAIFSPTKSLFNRVLRALIKVGPQHSTEAKVRAILELLPNAGIVSLSKVASNLRPNNSTIATHLLIIGFDYDRNRAAFFRSAKAGGRKGWGSGEISDIRLADAIHASTNAPVNYFDFPAIFPKGRRYWDGGVTGCNNPVLAAVTEALVLGVKPTDVVALSLGTGTLSLPWPKPGQPPSPFTQPPVHQSVLTDVKKLAASILDDPPDIATFLAHVMTGAGEDVPAPADSHIVRMSPLISPVLDANGNFSLPTGLTPDEFESLREMDIDVVEQSQFDTINKFAEHWLQGDVYNQPIRMNGATMRAEIGFTSFSKAKSVWEFIKDGAPAGGTPQQPITS
jgi:uncharacterized protein